MQICIVRAYSQLFQIEQMQDQAFMRAQGVIFKGSAPSVVDRFSICQGHI